MTLKSVWWIRPGAMLISLSAFMVSCTGVHTSHVPELEDNRSPSSVQYGVASWYGREFQGRPTASGEPFSMFDLTAAHRQAPFGTYARVTNLANGKTVQVRINDRGPFKSNRIIDLSYTAARQLGIHRTGIGKVKVELFEASPASSAPTTLVDSASTSSPPTAFSPPIASPPPTTSPLTNKYSQLFTVQAGAYREQTNARRVQQALTPLHSYVVLNPQPSTVGAGSLYRVHLGQFTSRQEAARLAYQVKKRGYAAVVVVLPSEQFSRLCTVANPC